MKPQDWVRATAPLDYAFQPIVSIHSGVCLGYEALLRGWDAAGFPGIHAVFDAAYADHALFSVELILREKAVRKFQTIPFHRKTKLFFNIDNRVLSMPDYSTGTTAQILRRYGLHPDTVVFELSEKHDLSASTQATQASLTSYKRQAYECFKRNKSSSFFLIRGADVPRNGAAVCDGAGASRNARAVQDRE